MFPGLPIALGHVRVGAAKTLEMKTVIYAQFNPVKTMRQLMDDRFLFRLGILTSLVIASLR